jgi:hypothetical protein
VLSIQVHNHQCCWCSPCSCPQGALAVDSALALVSELCALASPQQPVLIAIDDYNALYGQTDYGVWSSQGQQQQQGGGDDSEGGLLQEGSQPGPGGGPSLQGLRARRLLRVDELTLVSGWGVKSQGMPAGYLCLSRWSSCCTPSALT